MLGFFGMVYGRDGSGDTTFHPVENLLHEPEIPPDRVDDHCLDERVSHGETPGQTLTVDRVAVEVAAESRGKGTRPTHSVHGLVASKQPS